MTEFQVALKCCALRWLLLVRVYKIHRRKLVWGIKWYTQVWHNKLTDHLHITVILIWASWRHKITGNLTVWQQHVLLTTKKTWKLHITGPLWGESTSVFSSQRASNAGSLSNAMTSSWKCPSSIPFHPIRVLKSKHDIALTLLCELFSIACNCILFLQFSL